MMGLVLYLQVWEVIGTSRERLVQQILEPRTQVCFWVAIEALAVRRAEIAHDGTSFKALMSKQCLAKLRVEENVEESGVAALNICWVSQFHVIFT